MPWGKKYKLKDRRDVFLLFSGKNPLVKGMSCQEGNNQHGLLRQDKVMVLN